MFFYTVSCLCDIKHNLHVRVLVWPLYLQIHPLTLYCEDHLDHFKHLGQTTFPVIHLLLKCFDEPGCLHSGQDNLVVI